MKVVTPIRSRRNSRTFVAALLSYLMLAGQVAPLALAAARPNSAAPPTVTAKSTATAKSEAPAPPSGEAPAARPAPAPLAAPALVVNAPNVTATLDDGVALASSVAPGGTINYTANVSNATGTADATTVQFSDTVDTHTSITSNVLAGPLAIAHSYNTAGNTQVKVTDAASGLLSGVHDLDGVTPDANLAVTVVTGGSTSDSGKVDINADGTFTYTPVVGHHDVTDTFNYTVTDGDGLTGTGKVSISVGAVVWYLDVTNNGATDGSDIHPFKTFSQVTGATGPDVAGDIFFVKNTGTYDGNMTLLNNQQLYGSGATLTVNSVTINTAGTNTTIGTTTAATNSITLGSGNTVKGFTITNTTGAKIFGSAFGTLTLSNVTLSGSGQALDLTNGTLAATFDNITSTSSAATKPGINLNTVGGSLVVSGATSVSGSSAQGINLSACGVTANFGATTVSSTGSQGINVGGSTGALTFGATSVSSTTTQAILIGTTTNDVTFGATTVTGGNSDGVSFQNNSNAGHSITFASLSVTNNTGEGFVHGAGGGIVNVTGATTITHPGSTGVDISGSNANITFNGGVSIDKSTNGGTGVSITGTNTGRTFSFGSLSITTSAGTALSASSTGGTVATSGGTISATGGSAINATGIAFANGSTLTSASASGGGVSGITLTGVSGNMSVGGGTLTGNASAPTFAVSGGTVAFTYSGNVTQAANAAAVSVSNGHATGTITFNTGTVGATNGTGLQFDNADGTYNFNGTTTMNGGDAGVDILNGSSGTFSFNSSTTITSPSGTAFNVATSPGNPTVTYAGTITQNTLNQRVVNVDTTTGGSISFTDSTNGVTGGASSTGININAAAGNVSFAKLTLGTSGSRMVNQAVTITGGSGTYSLGTVSIFTTGAQGIVASSTTGTINTTTGTVDTTLQRAINIAGVNSGSKATLGMTLINVLSTSSSTNGITIQNTLGSFHVVGNSGTCTTATPTCTGGSIQSTTAEGILLNGAAGIQLAFMKIQSSGTDGIAASSVNGFTLDRSIITDTAGVSGDEGIQFNNVSGTVTVSNSTINGAPHNGIQLTNNNTNLTAFNLTNSTISNNGVANLVGNDGMLFVTQGTTNVTAATVSGCTFSNILATSLQPQTQDTSTITSFTVTGNTFSHQNMAFDGDVSQASHLTTTIGGPNASDTNTFTFTTGPNTINLDSATTSTSGATLTAKVQNNDIGTQGTNDSGGGGVGIRAAIQGATHGVVRIDNNRIREIPNGSGIKIFAVTGTGGANVEITNNSMPKPTGTSIDPGCGNGVRPCPTNTVDLEALNSNSMCAIVTGNSAWDPESFTDGAGQSAYFLLQSNPATFNLEGTGSAATYIAAHNTVTNSTGGTPDVQVFGTVNTVAAGTCGSFPSGPVIGSINTPNDAPATTAPAPTTAETLTAQDASTDAPASAGMPASLSNSLAEVASPGARATSVDAVPELSGAKRSEGSAMRHSARNSSAPLAAQPFAGVRGSAEASASAASNAPAASAAAPFTSACTNTTSSVQCSFPTLPAGSTVQFKFTATVNNPPALDATDLSGGPHVSTQGHVTADGGINVVTNDPETAASNDATVTNIDLFGTTTTLASDNNPSNGGELVTFTATVAVNNLPSTPPGGTNPTGTVNFIDTSNGNASVCSSVALSAGSAQCQTSTLTAGSTHNIQAVYSGDGNFDPSTSNTVAQQVIACDNPSIVTKTADDGALGSLRYAVAHVCTGGTVNFQIPDADAGHVSNVYTITLSGGEIPVGKSMTINGPNSVVNTDPVRISGGGTTRVFNVSAGTVGISNLTVTDGKVTNGNGAGLLQSGGTVTLTGMLFTGNTAVNGGGGALASVGGTLNVYNSTIDSNTATNGGGVFHDTAGTVALLNDTITSNTANGDVGAGPVGGGGDGGGVESLSGTTTTARNTIIALNSAGANADQAGVTDSGNNVIGTDPQVNALANNGGPTKTRSLKPNSPALDTGDNAAANAASLTTDQRGTGFPRIADSADADSTATVDIGAFELHPSVEDIPDKSTPEDTPLSFSFNVGDGTLLSSVTATSSNQTLVPDANILITGSGSSRTIQLTPATNANSTNDGTATITVTVTATNNQTATDTFVLTVNSVNDPPTANADTATAVEAGGVNNGTAGTDITGFNVITGVGTGSVADTDPDTGDTLTIQGVLDGNQGSTVLSGNVGVGISANSPNDYGTLTLQSDGSYNYVVNQSNAIVQGLRTSAQSVDDVFTYTLRDVAGATSNATITIHIQGANDNPVAGNDSANATEAGGINNGTAGSDPSGNVLTNDTDVDSAANGETQTVQGVLDGNQGSTVLNANVGAGISSSNNYGTLTVAANGNYSYVVNQNNTTVQALNTGGSVDDVFTYTMHDAAGATSNATITIHIAGANDAPAVTAGATLSYNENDAATVIDNTINVNDVDNANLSSATVQITGNYQNGEDVLSFTDTATITGVFNAATGTLTLSGSDTLANYQAALRSVKYQNTSDNPSTSARTVSWKVNDGSLDSNIATSTINVAATNDAPTLAINAGLSVSSGGSGTIDNTKLKVTDPDNTAAQLVFTVGTAPAHGTLKKGASTLSGSDTFTQADIDGNLISYTNNGDSAAGDSFTFTVSDGAGGTIGTTTFNITIAPPTLSALDAQSAEPSSGPSKMVFTVMLSRQFASTVTVDYATADGTATGGASCGGSTDYVNTSGTLTFNAGETIKTVEVSICSDGDAGSGAADETVLLNLTNPSNATIDDAQATGTIKHTNTPGTFIISEIRTSGPGGLGDDFVELYNNTDSPLTIQASDASGGYGLFKMGATCTDTPVLIAQIANGTVIPARGHYLLVGSQYSLGTYATGDQTLTSDIESDRNVALFTTSNVASISSVNRLDAVGFGSNVDAKPVSSDSVSASKRPQASISTDTPVPSGGFCDLFREGTNLPAANGSTLVYSFFRKECDLQPNLGCTAQGKPKDSNDNAADFMFADTQGTSTTMGQQLGAPGPENKASPINRDSTIGNNRLDSTQAAAANINRFRDPTPNTPNATVAPFGTLSLRRRVQNNTGGDVTRLRFRIIEVTTFPNAAGNADLRAITSSDVSVSNVHDTTTCVDRTAGTASNCTVNVKGTLLEQPPNQTRGGGYNSSWSVDLSGLSGGKLAPGQSVEVQLQLGVVQPGSFRILVVIEALP